MRANVKGGEQKAVKFSWMPRLNRGMTESVMSSRDLIAGSRERFSSALRFPGFRTLLRNGATIPE